jgi:DeoR/GlpR family transcriptional regulator of sugar metabolism
VRYERFLAIADRHGRLIDLIRRGEFSSSVLAEKLGCSEQTVYRDIDFLNEQGYSIRAIRHAKGWAYKLLGELTTVQAAEEAAHK